MDKNLKYDVAWSGGKDSTAMLLLMIEKNIQIDNIYFCDTKYEFNDLYEYLYKIIKIIKREVIFVNPNNELFSYSMKKVTKGKNKGKMRKLPLTAFPCWYKREAKVENIRKIRLKSKNKIAIGIAYDEQSRLSVMKDHDYYYPLAEWKMTENDCVNYLKKRKLLNPLYEHFYRLGCFWCPKQSEYSLWVTWKYYPLEWKKCLQIDEKSLKICGRPIRINKTYLEIQDKFEDGFIPKLHKKYSCDEGCIGVKQDFENMEDILF